MAPKAPMAPIQSVIPAERAQNVQRMQDGYLPWTQAEMANAGSTLQNNVEVWASYS